MSPEKVHKRAVSGVLDGLSHVFYNAGEKAFMAKIKVDGGDGHYDIHFVLFPIKHKILRRYLLHDRYLRLIGRPVTVTNVSPASILDNVPVLVAKQSSQLTLAVKRGKCNVAPSSPPPSQIEGIVTDDADADCGVYTLNRRKTLVVTSLCQVTNVRRLSKGQTVLVVNGHTVEGEAGDVIVACGRSYVADRNGEHDSVYASDEYHSIVNVALKKFLSYRTVLQLVQIRRAIITKFPEIRDRLVSCMDDRFTDELINVWDAESLSKSTGTSPLREFCCSEELHTCYSLGDDCESQRRIKCPASIANVKDGIEGALSNLSTRDAKTGARLVYSTAFSESIDKDLVVIGRIATSTVLGRLQIQDATESILLHVHGEEGADEGEDLVNEVVFLQSFVAVREELHAPGTGWDLTYLTVERRHIKVIPFFSTADTKLLQLTGEKNCGTVKYTVVNVSDSLYHANRSCVVACVRGRNGAGSRFARLYHSDLGGSVTVRSGTELVFAESDVREAGSKMFSAKKMELFAANSRVLDFKTPPLLKKVSRIRAKVYTLDELDAITNCEAVSIRGVLRQRWLEEDRFSDNLKTARKTRDPHIPNWLQLHLKISVDSNVQGGNLMNDVAFFGCLRVLIFPKSYNVRRPLKDLSLEEFVLGVQSDKEISMTGSTPKTNSSELGSLSGCLTLYFVSQFFSSSHHIISCPDYRLCIGIRVPPPLPRLPISVASRPRGPNR